MSGGTISAAIVVTVRRRGFFVLVPSVMERFGGDGDLKSRWCCNERVTVRACLIRVLGVKVGGFWQEKPSYKGVLLA